MTARLPSDDPNTRLTLSARGEVPPLDARSRDLDARTRAVLGGGYQWPEMAARDRRQATPPRRIDWYRVAAFLIVAGAAAMTFLGLWLIMVYILTAF